MAMNLAVPVVRNRPLSPTALSSLDLGATTKVSCHFTSAESGFCIRLSEYLYKSTTKE